MGLGWAVICPAISVVGTLNWTDNWEYKVGHKGSYNNVLIVKDPSSIVIARTFCWIVGLFGPMF